MIIMLQVATIVINCPEMSGTVPNLALCPSCVRDCLIQQRLREWGCGTSINSNFGLYISIFVGVVVHDHPKVGVVDQKSA